MTNQKGSRSRDSALKRILIAVGGLVGLVTIVGVIIAGLAFIQSLRASDSQDQANATVVSILGQQLSVQQQIATKQADAVAVGGGPQATVIGQEIVQLMATQAALEAELQRVGEGAQQPGEALTPVAIAVTQVPSDSGAASGASGVYSRGSPPVPAPLGWVFEQDGVELNLVRAEISADDDFGKAAAQLWFSILNKSPQELLVEFDHSQLYIVDAKGTRYVDYDGPEIESFWLEPSEARIFDRYYAVVPGERSRIPASGLPITVYADALSRVQGAQWMVGGPPVFTYSEGDAAPGLGTSFDLDGFGVMLTDLKVRTSEDYGGAAFEAYFSVRNETTQQKLLELDYAYIYIEDNFGTRYIDWDAVGLDSVWVEPGEEVEFTRYYSTGHDERSRVPVGTTYVVVVSEGIASGARVQWRHDIVR